jgi:hypothetical protein
VQDPVLLGLLLFCTLASFEASTLRVWWWIVLVILLSFRENQTLRK